MASLAATTPPTGIVPGAEPAGHASGITVPATKVGTRISSAICRSTPAMLSASSGSSARMLSVKGSPPEARSGTGFGAGGGAKPSMTARMVASPAPAPRAVSASAMAAANHGPGR